MLNEYERQRYDRQIIMRGFGEEGQEKLKRAKVVIAGGGGLGSPSSIYLAAAGVGTLRIIDHDTVELSNLNRQILHWDRDIGRNNGSASCLFIFGNVNLEIFELSLSGTPDCLDAINDC